MADLVAGVGVPEVSFDAAVPKQPLLDHGRLESRRGGFPDGGIVPRDVLDDLAVVVDEANGEHGGLLS